MLWMQVPCSSQSSSSPNQQGRVVRRISQHRGGTRGTRRHGAGPAGGRHGQRGAERDRKWRDWGGRLRPDVKEDYCWGLGVTLMMKPALQIPSGPHSMVMDNPPPPYRRKRGGMRQLAEGAGRAEKQNGGRREEGWNVEIYIHMLTLTMVVKTFFLQSRGYAIGEDKVILILSKKKEKKCAFVQLIYLMSIQISVE